MEMLHTQLIALSGEEEQISRRTIETMELKENMVDELSKRISALAAKREQDHITV